MAEKMPKIQKKRVIDQENWTAERQRALLSLERVKNWKTLDPKKPEDREKRFLLALRNLKKTFTIETKKFSGATDLDSRAALQLFRSAGMNVVKINYVPSGKIIENSIHLDTGNKEGLTLPIRAWRQGSHTWTTAHRLF